MKNPLEILNNTATTIISYGEEYWLWAIIGTVITIGVIIWLIIK